jgi:hypothetical protein
MNVTSPKVSGRMAGINRPVPQCPIVVISPASPDLNIPITAILDTGAALTVLPKSIKSSLDPKLEYVSDVKYRGIDGRESLTSKYIVNINMCNHIFHDVEVIFIFMGDFTDALIGRNLLENHKLVLNWRAKSWQMNCNNCEDCNE